MSDNGSEFKNQVQYKVQYIYSLSFFVCMCVYHAAHFALRLVVLFIVFFQYDILLLLPFRLMKGSAKSWELREASVPHIIHKRMGL